jgi:hypothetical protein
MCTLPGPAAGFAHAARIDGPVSGSMDGSNPLIVTFNLSDFPASILQQFQIEAIHPDQFIVGLWDDNPDDVLEAVRFQRAGLKKPPRTAMEYLATIEQCQLPETAACLRPYADQI